MSNTKDKEATAAVAIMAVIFLSIAVLCASIAVGIISGNAGYGFAVFAAASFINFIYLYLTAIFNARKLKKKEDEELKAKAASWSLFKDEEVIDVNAGE